MNNAPKQSSPSGTSSWVRVVPAWVIGTLAAYPVTGFLSNFYPSIYQFVLLSLFFQSLCGITLHLLMGMPGIHFRRDPTVLLASGTVFAFCIAVLKLCWQFPEFFDRHILFMDVSLLPIFLISSFFSAGLIATFATILHRKGVAGSPIQSNLLQRLNENLPGIILASIFFLVYFALAESINFPGFNTVDQFFDFDISEWLTRLTSPDRLAVPRVRAVHPAVLIFLRSIIWFVSVLLNGNRLHAVFLVNALAGASCVYLVWAIIRRITKNTAYSMISASLLGASTSHLLSGSMLETYIYSALALLLFVSLILDENKGLKHMVPAGALVFGITISNIAQTCILYFFTHPKIKLISKYLILVVTTLVLLNALQVWVYPNAKYVFVPSNFLVEQHYRFDFSKAPWLVWGHTQLIVRAITLYGIVAPTPFILTHELGAVMPNFRTFEIVIEGFRVAGYTGLADVTVKFWILIIAIAGLLFLRDLFRSPRQMLFPVSLLLCLGFNFALHLAYGDDPMLYSANWVYALVLFISFAFRKWADQKWLHLLLIVFLGLTMSANIKLLHLIMESTLPFYG